MSKTSTNQIYLPSVINNYRFQQILGQGSFGKVYKVIKQKSLQQFAIKVLSIYDQRSKQLLQSEIEILQKCKSQNIVRFIEYFNDNRHIYIVLQYCNEGDLSSFLFKNNEKLSQQMANKFLGQIMNGFRTLNLINAVHRDFKPKNILIHNGICKIADFGLSKILKECNQQLNTQLGTMNTMAPQILQGLGYKNNIDIWSIGIVYYLMIFGIYPNKNLDIHTLLSLNKVKISQNGKDFLQKCLIKNPQKRMNWNQIFDHPLVKQNMVIPKQQIKQLTYTKERKQIINQQSPQKLKIYTAKIKAIIKSNFIIYKNSYQNMIKIFPNYIKSLIFQLKIKYFGRHWNILLLICKNIYDKVDKYHLKIIKNQNFLKIPYFEYFIITKHYEQIKKYGQNIKLEYEQQIKNLSDKVCIAKRAIINELNCKQIKNENCNIFLKDQLYKFIQYLIRYLVKVFDEQHTKLIKLILVLIFYCKNEDNMDLLKLQKYLNQFNYELKNRQLSQLLMDQIQL